ncbi:unnamed protein product [Ceutorhynchus assimilis]|uniref:Uncharacterized protein n=1 Tax=Ceutorhynchus assimilis TaxID=467358 RepID=A0A9N9QJQ0_9CUCU|nr:unnamed protein product [Ceutorhynchus assimilis]
MDVCVLCGLTLIKKTVKIKQKGLQTLKKASKERNDGKLKLLENKTELMVHVKCRRDYTRPTSIKASKNALKNVTGQPTSRPHLRSSVSDFNFKSECIFCAKKCLHNRENRTQKTSLVTTLEVKDTIIKHSTNNKNCIEEPHNIISEQILKEFKVRDCLWLSRFILDLDKKPFWNGFKAKTVTGDFQTTSVTPVPFINLDPSLDPSNLTTIHTAHHFAADSTRKSFDLSEVLSSPVINATEPIVNQLESRIKIAREQSRTGKLWCEYWEQIDLMNQLETSMSEEDYDKFCASFTIRRLPDKFWQGLWTDITIEQVLVRSMKSEGGLTRGRGLTEAVLGKWVLSMPESTRVCESLETFSKSRPCYSEQHVELRDSRGNRDYNDLQRLLSWLEFHNPFDDQINSLLSISSSLVASVDINCDSAREVGENLLSKCIGLNFQDLRLKRNDKIKPLSFMFKTLKGAGIKDIQARGDADTVLVDEAITIGKSGSHVVLVGDDTDLVVLLMYKVQDEKIFMLRPRQIWKTESSYRYFKNSRKVRHPERIERHQNAEYCVCFSRSNGG